MMRSNVVFPQPDGPTRAISAPLGTARSTSSTAANAPNRLVTPRNVMFMLFDVPRV